MSPDRPLPDQQVADANLELGRLKLAFLSPETERSYRAWRIDATTAYWRLAALIGAICLGVVFPLLYMNDAEALVKILPIMVPAALCTALYFLLAPATRMGWLGMPLLATIGGLYMVGIVWHRHEIAIYDSLDSNILHAAGVAIVLTLIVFCISRVTPKWAWAAALPGIVEVIYFAVTDHQAGLISDQAFRGAIGLIAVGGVAGALGNLFTERNLRVSFAQQQVITRQQRHLESSQEAIRRYVPPSVAKKIIAGDLAAVAEPKRTHVTILFADLAGFTSVADRVEPEAMSQVLNEYLSAMSEIVAQHGGTLNEFSGDGVMAIWGAPDAQPPANQVGNAIKAAQSMHDAIVQLNMGWKKLGLDEPLSARIGINSGMASVGSYGSQGRSTYTAIGLQTNIASRMESHAPVGGVLLSGAAYELIRDQVPCTLYGEVECKGVHFPIKAYMLENGSTNVVQQVSSDV